MKLFYIALICCCLSSCSAISRIQEDGGFMCSESIYYRSESPLARKEGTFTKYEYGDELSGDYTSVDKFTSSRVTIKNKGLDAKNVSISMYLEADGIKEEPIELGVCSSELELCIDQTEPIFNVLIPAGAYYWIFFKFDRAIRANSTLKQTILIGESEPSDIIVSQKLTRKRRTYNCIFGDGSPYYRGDCVSNCEF